MEYLNVYLLGAPRIERNGESVKVDTRKAVALLAYLAVTAESHTRDTLSALFWPDSDLSRARGALRRTLSALNRALAGEGLRADRSTVRFEPGARRWLDFNEFRARLRACTAHGHNAVEVCSACLPLLREATELYRGDFLAGFTLRDSPAFDEWQFFEAESLRRELGSALERLARGHGARGEFESAVGYTRRWIALDPLHEPAHRWLML